MLLEVASGDGLGGLLGGDQPNVSWPVSTASFIALSALFPSSRANRVRWKARNAFCLFACRNFDVGSEQASEGRNAGVGLQHLHAMNCRCVVSL